MTYRSHLLIILLIVAITIARNTQAQKPITEDVDLAKQVELSSADIEAYWETIFLRAQRPYDSPRVRLFREQSVHTACGRNSWVVGAFYCPFDNTIYLPYRFMQFQRDKIGDSAVTLIITHEWGHVAQAQLNTLRDKSLVVAELQADCFAGAYARQYVLTSNIITVEKSRFERDARILYSVGDRDIFWFDPQTHGTVKQRIAAFDVGFNHGYAACLPD